MEENSSKNKSAMNKYAVNANFNWWLLNFSADKSKKPSYCLYYRVYSFQLQSIWRRVAIPTKRDWRAFFGSTVINKNNPICDFCNMLANANMTQEYLADSPAYEMLLKYVENLCDREMDVQLQFAIGVLEEVNQKKEMSIIFISKIHDVI